MIQIIALLPLAVCIAGAAITPEQAKSASAKSLGLLAVPVTVTGLG